MILAKERKLGNKKSRDQENIIGINMEILQVN